MKFLSKRETENIFNKAGLPTNLTKEYALVQENEKIFIVSGDIRRVSIEHLNAKRIGLLLAKTEGNHIHLTKAASDLFLA